MQNENKNKRKILTGVVVSTAMTKTVVVEVIYAKKHPLYGKAVKKRRHFACHNELSDITKGDVVAIREIKPMSKTKFFEVAKKMTI